MKARDWIDRVKAEKGLSSDYSAAKLLGLSRFTVSGYRNRIDATFDVAVSARVADVLGVSFIGIVIDQVAERTKSNEISAALREEAARLCILCKVGRATDCIATCAHGALSAAAMH